MENKTLSALFFIVLVSLVLSTFAFAGNYDYTESESITCGDGFCEHMSIKFNNIGQEKQVSIAGKTYKIKILDTVQKSDGKYSVILNINGSCV